MAQPNTEFRVLSGTHAGARLPLLNPIIVGSHPNCDIVLTDPGIQPRHISITLVDTQWSIQGVDDVATHKETLALGEQFWLGMVAITVDRVDAPWPITIAPPTKTTQATADSTTTPATVAQDELVVETALPALKRVTTGSQNILITLWHRCSHMVIVTTSLILLSIAGILAANAIQNNAIHHKNDQDIHREHMIYDRVHAIIEAHHFNDLLVSIGKKRDITITGWVDTQEALYHLQRLFLDFTPRVTILPNVYSTFQQEVSKVVSQYGHGISVQFDKPGNLVLTGYGTETAITHLVDTLIATVPSIHKIRTEDVQRPQQISTAFYDRIRAEGLKNVDFFFDGQKIHVHGTLTSTQITQWEALLIHFQKEYGHLVPVEAIIDEMPDVLNHNGDGTPPSVASASTHNEYGAYGIHSVIGGLNKYLITRDGRVVTIGGRIGPFRLQDITLKTIVLDGPQHLTINR